LFRCRGAVPLVYWSAPLDHASGDWPSRSAFLPFFGELLNSMRTHRRAVALNDEQPGSPLTRLVPLQHERVALLDEQDTALPVSVAAAALEGRRFVSEPIAEPGLYRWRADGADEAVQVVNFPARESDLRAAPPPVPAHGSAVSLRRAADLTAESRGLPLWKPCLWAALGLVVLEALLILWADLDTRRLTNGRSGWEAET
jgi:hypothetical protein